MWACAACPKLKAVALFNNLEGKAYTDLMRVRVRRVEMYLPAVGTKGRRRVKSANTIHDERVPGIGRKVMGSSD